MRPVSTLRVFVIIVLAAAIPARAAEPHLSLIYSLPADGEWVEFDYDGSTLVSRETGTLRISSVGKKSLNGSTHRWVELRIDGTSENRQKTKQLAYLKLLVVESAVTAGKALKGHIVEAYAKQGKDGAVSRLKPEDVDLIATLAIRSDATRLKLIKDMDEVPTKLGTFKARHLALHVKPNDPKAEGADFWLCDEVPFGWVQAEVRSIGLFKLTAVKKGKDAKTELDETLAR